MSTISPMTPRPQPAASGDQPVVSLQQRLSDRLAQAPQETQAGQRRKKERTGEEALALQGAMVQQPLQAHAEEALRRDAAAATATGGREQADASAPVPQDGSVVPASTGAELQQAVPEPSVRSPVADAQVERSDASASTRTDATELPTMGASAAGYSESTATATTATRVAEPIPVAPRWASATPAPAAPAPASPGGEGSSVTVAFQSWGAGHEVRAQWLPGGGVLVPGSERVGLALSAAASQPDAAIAGDNWRVERTDADAEQRERPRGDAEQDA